MAEIPLSKMAQYGMTGVALALIGLVGLLVQVQIKNTEKVTELVEVTRQLGPAVRDVADSKTDTVLSAIASTCRCSRAP